MIDRARNLSLALTTIIAPRVPPARMSALAPFRCDGREGQGDPMGNPYRFGTDNCQLKC